MRKLVVLIAALAAFAVPVTAQAADHSDRNAARAAERAARTQARIDANAAQLQAKKDRLAARLAERAARRAARQNDSDEVADATVFAATDAAPVVSDAPTPPYVFQSLGNGSSHTSLTVDDQGNVFFSTSGLTPGVKYAASCEYQNEEAKGWNLGFSSWFANSSGVLTETGVVPDFTGGLSTPGLLHCWFRADTLVWADDPIRFADDNGTAESTVEVIAASDL